MEDDGLQLELNGREHPTTVRSQMKELIKTNEELKITKDQAMQSWLDSKPLIDDLEKLQSGVDAAKNRESNSKAVISDLQSELEDNQRRIRSKMEEELQAMKATSELTKAVDHTCKDLEAIKLEADEHRRERLKLKQLLRIRRQTLRSLQLKLRAVRIEAEASVTSLQDASANIDMSKAENNNNSIQLTADEYVSLARRAQEEKSLSQWRVTAAEEQKLEAEANKNIALSRLSQVYKAKRSRQWEEEDEEDGIVEDDDEATAAVAEGRRGDSSGRVGGEIVIPKARARAMREEECKMRESARSGGNNNSSSSRKRMVVKQKRRKKQSFLGKITNLINGIKKWFR